MKVSLEGALEDPIGIITQREGESPLSVDEQPICLQVTYLEEESLRFRQTQRSVLPG